MAMLVYFFSLSFESRKAAIEDECVLIRFVPPSSFREATPKMALRVVPLLRFRSE